MIIQKIIENDLTSYKILIDNFPGGNSGEDVNLSENNAITTDLATFCEVVINTNINVDDIFK